MAPLVPPPAPQGKDADRFIRDLDRRLERVDRAILAADWDLFSGRTRRGSARWQLERADLLSDERLLPWVRSALRRSRAFPARRRLELLERILLDARVEQDPEVVRRRSDLQERIVAFRPRWKGKRVNRAVIYRVHRESPREADRRSAHYAFEPIYRPLEGAFRELVEIRNERAKALGYRSFAEMRLGFQGLTPERLEELADNVGRLARGHLRSLRDRFRTSTGQSGWHPWDFSHARFRQVPLSSRWFPRDEMVPRILDAIRKWGFRTQRMRFRVVFHDLPAGGLTLAPDPPRDVRVLVHPQGGWMAYVVMFHELGHAVHSASIRAPRHLLRWHENVPGFGGFHEGIGSFFEDIPCNARWLAAQPGVGRARAEAFSRSSRDANLLDVAANAAWLRIEQTLYRYPERDPMPSVQRFERSVFGYDDYEPQSFVDSFFVDDPIYSSNYLLALLFGRQLSHTLVDLFGEPLWPNAKVGPWLTRNWLAPGSLYDWVPRLKEVTGRPFGTDAFVEEFGAG